MENNLRKSRERRELTSKERQRAISEILTRSTQGKPRRGAMHEVAAQFGVHRKTVQRLWRRAKENAALSGIYEAPSRKHLTGRRPRDLSSALERLRHVDLQRRTTIRSAAAACGVSASTLFRRLKQGKLRSSTSVALPLLTEDNLQARLKFCFDHVKKTDNMYVDMTDIIPVDKKYFYLTVVKRRFILLHNEPEPVRKLKSKRHITKVMMLSAVARQRYNANGESIFDGKLGTWPFVEYTVAQMTSRNRVAGTPVTKPVTATQGNYREMLVD
ncbi:hypothetical protein JG688_00007083 [Phytophthora aleatoria]|uniref:Transposase Tc1-like domain-containing protein n=1 Tax=Phytophthora aleatoria TaxID=2496075 RepID=A0A8J5J6H3_9STRA|nr:hypothetical protein JG688_00007083 [Phytophthora aleatoria]